MLFCVFLVLLACFWHLWLLDDLWLLDELWLLHDLAADASTVGANSASTIRANSLSAKDASTIRADSLSGDATTVRASKDQRNIQKTTNKL